LPKWGSGGWREVWDISDGRALHEEVKSRDPPAHAGGPLFFQLDARQVVEVGLLSKPSCFVAWSLHAAAIGITTLPAHAMDFSRLDRSAVALIKAARPKVRNSI